MTDAINCVPPVSGSGGSQLVATAIPATDLLVRTYADGSAAVLNLQPFSDRTLVAEHNGTRTTFTLPARGVVLFDAAGRGRPALPAGGSQLVATETGGSRSCATAPAAVRSLVNVEWDLTLDAPNIRRVNFDPSRKGSLTVAAPLKGVRLLTRDCAMSYAVTSSGRPIGINEEPAKGDKVIRHIAESYAFEMDGAKVESPEPCTSLRPCYDPLYRQTKPFDLTAGEHAFAIASGEADSNFFRLRRLQRRAHAASEGEGAARSARRQRAGRLHGHCHVVGRGDGAERRAHASASLDGRTPHAGQAGRQGPGRARLVAV